MLDGGRTPESRVFRSITFSAASSMLNSSLPFSCDGCFAVQIFEGSEAMTASEPVDVTLSFRLLRLSVILWCWAVAHHQYCSTSLCRDPSSSGDLNCMLVARGTDASANTWHRVEDCDCDCFIMEHLLSCIPYLRQGHIAFVWHQYTSIFYCFDSRLL